MQESAGPTVEVELKLQVPPQRMDDVVRSLGRLPGGTRRVHLEAHYLDTPDFRLSAAGFAWRLRREDGEWVQTLKSRAAGTGFGRLEHNVTVAHASDTTPAPDPSLHDGTPAGDRLRSMLDSIAEPIGIRYGTDIDRLVANQTTVGGGTVELALDRGVIVAGDRRADVHELEIELVEGSVSDVVDAALDWAGTNGLWSDSMHKARRGMLLAMGVTTLPVQRPGDTSVASLVAAIRSNLSAVCNRMGAAEHLLAIAADLRRVATAIGEPRADELHEIAGSIEALGRDPEATADDRMAVLTDPTVTVAVIGLLRHLG